MKAVETKANQLFDGGQQLSVPVWQRRYSWGRPEWEALWRDLMRLRNTPPSATHFLGSVVVRVEPYSGLPNEARRFDVVDGQQRVATLTILLVAIRDRVEQLKGPESGSELTKQLLINAEKKLEHQPRLVLQSTDDPALRALVNRTAPVDGPIRDCYKFFADAIKSYAHADLLKLISLVSTRVDAVWITLDESDNAHRVFQTINAGGLPLRQTDLVRNFFFLLLGTKGKDFYEQHWFRLEKDFDAVQLGKYFSAWSTAQGHAGSSQLLFAYFSADLASTEDDRTAVWKYGERLVKEADLYRIIVGKAKDENAAVERAMDELRRWGTKAAEGLIFKLFRLRAERRIQHKHLAESLGLIYSFFARRFVAGYSPNLHRSILRQIAHKLNRNETATNDEVVLLLRVILSRGSELKKWPVDDYVVKLAADTLLYTSARAHWAWSILERINRSLYANPKQAPASLERTRYQIEHVMPQELSGDWNHDLADWGVANAADFHLRRTHVLGNLTLSPINPELSNHRLAKKVALIQDDTLKLNAELKNAESWTETVVGERSRRLAVLLVKSLTGPMTQAEIDATPFASEHLEEQPEESDGDEEG